MKKLFSLSLLALVPLLACSGGDFDSPVLESPELSSALKTEGPIREVSIGVGATDVACAYEGKRELQLKKDETVLLTLLMPSGAVIPGWDCADDACQSRVSASKTAVLSFAVEAQDAEEDGVGHLALVVDGSGGEELYGMGNVICWDTGRSFKCLRTPPSEDCNTCPCHPWG